MLATSSRTNLSGYGERWRNRQLEKKTSRIFIFLPKRALFYLTYLGDESWTDVDVAERHDWLVPVVVHGQLEALSPLRGVPVIIGLKY